MKYVEPESSLSAVIPESFSTTSADTSPRTAQGTLLGSTNAKTQVLPEEDKPPRKIAQLPLHLIVPLIIVAAAAGIGYWYREQRSQVTTVPNTPSPTTTVQPTPEPPVQRTIDNINTGWVIQTTATIPLANKESLPPKNFLQVIKTTTNPQSANKDLLVELEVCPNKNTSTPAKNDSPIVQEPKIIAVSQAQLKKYKVAVLQANQANPCGDTPPEPINQPPAPTLPDEVNPAEPNTP